MEKTKWDIEKAKKLFSEKGITLLEKEFKNVDFPMECIALCGHIKKLTLSNLLIEHGLYCKKCGFENRSAKRVYKYDYVYNYFEENECKLISNEYKGSQAKLNYIAKCGHENEITFSKFKNSGQGRLCKKCCKPSGNKHHAYNENLTDEERISNRDYYEIILWRLNVFKKDNYSCVCCGDDKGGNLNAHHLNGYNWDVENRLNTENGITLCKKCHENFHKEYGFGNNTKEQFKKWICEYRGNLVDSEQATRHRNA